MIFNFEARRLFMGIEDGGNRPPESNDIPVPRTEKTPEQRADMALEASRASRNKIQTAENISKEFKDKDSFDRGVFERQLLGESTSRSIFEQFLKPELQNILKGEPKNFDRPELQQSYEKAQEGFREFMKTTKLNPEQQMAVWRSLKSMLSGLTGNPQDYKAQTEAFQRSSRFLESLKQPLNARSVSASDWGGVSEHEMQQDILDTLYLGDTGIAQVNQRRDQILEGNNQRFLGKTQAETALRVAITEYEQRNREDGQRLFTVFGLKPVDLLKAPSEFQQFLSRAENLADRGIGLANEFVRTQYLNETIKALQNGEPLSDEQKLALAVPNGIGAILKLPVSLPVAISKIKPLLDKITVSEQRDEMFSQIGNAVEKYWETSNKADKTALVIELGTSFVFFGWLVKSLKSPNIATELAEEVENLKTSATISTKPSSPQMRNPTEIGRTAPETTESAAIYEQFPVLKEHAEYLGELKRSDILGIGTQGIVVQSQKTNIVAKIGLNPEAHQVLAQESVNHNIFLNAINAGHKSGNIPDWIDAPKIPVHIKQKTGVLTMDTVQGQSLKTVQLRQSYSELLQNIPPTKLNKMTDHQVEHLLTQRGVDPAIIEMTIEDATIVMSRLFPQKSAEFSKAIEYLKSQGIQHKDLHSGNVMVDQNGKVYIIDFGSIAIKH